MRQRWYYKPGHPKANERGFVSAEDLGDWQDPALARNAPIMVDRFYENTAATDGTDIGSRSKHREYMKRNGLTSASDYGQRFYEQKAKERSEAFTGPKAREERKEAIGRAMYEHQQRRK